MIRFVGNMFWGIPLSECREETVISGMKGHLCGKQEAVPFEPASSVAEHGRFWCSAQPTAEQDARGNVLLAPEF